MITLSENTLHLLAFLLIMIPSTIQIVVSMIEWGEERGREIGYLSGIIFTFGFYVLIFGIFLS